MIKELKKGQRVSDFKALVSKSSVLQTKSGKDYVALSLMDSSGSIECRIWDCSTIFETGRVVACSGIADEYNGSVQLSLSSCVIDPNADPCDYGRQSRFGIKDSWSELVNIVGEIHEPLTKFVAEEILLKQGAVSEAYMLAPAATGVHNAWYGGLMEHSISMARLSKEIVNFYIEHYSAVISLDKVLFGCLVHDAGKMIEYNVKNPAFPKTGIGVLTNHIVMGAAWVFEVANKFPGKTNYPNFKMERAHLMHLIASHHGKAEWGAPVPPATLEAIVLHQVDMVDSSMMHAIEAIEGGEGGDIPGFTKKSWVAKTPFFINGKV